MVNLVEQIRGSLDRNEQFIINKKGVLRTEGRAIRFIRKIFGWESGWIMNVSRACNNILDNMEKNPQLRIENIEAFQLVKEKLSACKTKNARNMLSELSIRVEALRYRLEDANNDHPANEELLRIAQEWKDNYELYEEKPLTAKELVKLNEMAQYPSYTQLIINGDSKLKDECFKWILRDNNSVEAYVKFPTLCKKLKSSLLAGRIGRFASTSLKVEKNDVTLPFEVEEDGELISKRISILDEKKVVHLRGGYSLSIDAIFNIFKKKNDDVGNLEYFGRNGISNYNVHELGWWNEAKKDYERIDLENPNWWEHLPVYETLSTLEVRQRFNLDHLEEEDWIAVARSSSESIEMDIDRSHGYLGLAIPQGDGQWRMYDFGKYAHHFPSHIIQKILMIGNTVKAKIAYFDENDIYSQRIQAKAPIILTPEQGNTLMEDIKKDIIKAREGNIVFQFGWENCAFWPADKLQKLLGDECPNFFRSPAAFARPKTQPLKSFFSKIRNSSPRVQRFAFRSLEKILFSSRGIKVTEDGKTVIKSVRRSEFHHTQEMFHPAFNHQQIREGKYPGVITFGHINTEFEVQ